MIIRLDEEWSTYKKLLFLKALGGSGAKEYEITGNPVAFNTNVQKPLSGFTIPFLPVQQGTGDPSPQNQRPIIGWQGLTACRTGKNLFDENSGDVLDAYLTTDAISGKNGQTRSVFIKCKPNTAYTIQKNAGERFAVAYTKEQPQYNTEIFGRVVDHTATSITITTGQDAEYLVTFVYNASYDTGTADTMLESVQIEVGDTASPYSPYTGKSYPVTFPAVGKNLFNIAELFVGTGQSVTGAVVTKEYSAYNFDLLNGTTGASAVATKKILLSAGSYVFSGTFTGTGGVRIYKCDADGVVDSTHIAAINSSTSQSSFTLETATYITMRYAARDACSVENMQIEVGSSASSYEPYTNTVYGGALDAVNRVLMLEWVKVLLDDADAWAQSGSTFLSYTGYSFNDRKTGSSWNLLCPFFPASQASSGTAYIRWGGLEAGNILVAPNGSSLTVDDLKTMSENKEIYIVYPLATPIEIPLDPITVQTLIGDNTIWTDTNGENTIRYKKKG